MRNFKCNLREGSPDFSMTGTRRAEAPGNIRANTAVRSGRKSLSDDAESEEQEQAQNRASMPAAVAVLVTDGDKILAVSRFDDRNDLNMPGGAVEPGEDPLEAAARELYEETGLIAHDLVPIHTRIYGGRVVTTYKARSYMGSLRASWEGVPSWESPEILSRSKFGDYFDDMLLSLRGSIFRE